MVIWETPTCLCSLFMGTPKETSNFWNPRLGHPRQQPRYLPSATLVRQIRFLFVFENALVAPSLPRTQEKRTPQVSHDHHVSLLSGRGGKAAVLTKGALLSRPPLFGGVPEGSNDSISGIIQNFTRPRTHL